MKRRMSSSVIARIAGVGLVGALVAVLGAGTASATVVTKTYPFDCNIPIFGHKILNIKITANIPTTGHVGVPVVTTGFSATAPIPSDVYSVFTPFGADHADGTATASAKINTVPQTNLPISATIPLTLVPNPAGPPMNLVASGPVPNWTPTAAGTFTVSAGSTFTALVTPRHGTAPTVLGTLTVPCTATVAATPLSTIVISP